METTTETKPIQKKKNPLKFIIIGAILAIGLFFGIKYLLFMLHHETTDNAQLATNQYHLIPQVSGRITKTFVNDYQNVKKGDTLFTIDTSNYAIQVAVAEANLQNSIANLEVAKRNPSTLKTGLGVSSSNIKAVEASKIKAEQDLQRAQNLVNEDVITKASFDAVQAEATAAEAQYQAAKAQYAVSEKQVGTAEDGIKAAEAIVKMREADLANAKLIYSYTTITAPNNGRLAEVGIKEGQFVQAGQPLTDIIGSNIWVVANFKETQLNKIKEGDIATITVDTYPDKVFNAKVTMLSPATGSTYALLPPDNATGNFVKVVQLVPVKLEFTDVIPTDYNLEAGMSVTVSIPTHTK
ncbi:HlyD family secretion protein [Bizionia arctica]|uniref:Multidrug resistance protein A n=1 Tax=Bizionia arctica TaxID=1495645 RepID=A0A917LPB2_9FLAO|nr:HlyD family secretion protein [Bizionia arctica]GGG49084.1 multidrug resistance protein A [Bizionia arctica]